MPKPRRKFKWEIERDQKYDLYYKAVNFSIIPANYLKTYETIFVLKLMPQIVALQRFIKKKQFKKWLAKNESKQLRTREKLEVDVGFLTKDDDENYNCKLF